MPRRNVLKPKLWRTAYHVWNRGKNRQLIFRDREDRRYFKECLSRHVCPATHRDASRRRYRPLGHKVRIWSLALMPNHFHLVLFQIDPDGIEMLMRSAVTAYVAYFNAKYGESGPLFAGPYRARALGSPGKTRTAIAYVHDNHGPDCRCEFCTHSFFIDASPDPPSWLDLEGALGVFGGANEYLSFRRDRARMKQLTT